MRHRRGRWLGAALGLALVVAFAPTRLGGPTDYVRTTGDSMEPMFHAGDLAVVRQASRYRVGDVVAYRSAQLDTVVMHRIVDVDDGRFTLQGDNNDFLDPERPTADDIVGRLWIRVPRGGAVMNWVSQPVNAVGVVLVVALLAGSIGVQRRRPPRSTPGRRERHVTRDGPRGAPLPMVSQVLGTAGLVLVAAGALAFTRATERAATETIDYTHHGTLSYDASVTAPLVYPDGVETGDPIYRQLVDEVDLSFEYELEAAGPLDVEGDVSLEATLRGGNGWERQLPVLGSTTLDDATATVEGTIDLAELDRMATEISTLTGLPTGELRVVIEPSVDIQGTIAGAALDDRFSAPATFALDALQFRPVDTEDDGFTTTSDGSVIVTGTEAAQMALFGMEADVSLVRAIGLGAGAVLLVAALIGWWLTNRRIHTETDRIAARHRALLVPVADAGNFDHPAVDLASFDALARIAVHHDVLVLDHQCEDRHTYLVHVAGVSYRYSPPVD